MEKLKIELLRTLSNLAAGSDDQEIYIKKIGTYPLLDELALEFDDVYQRVIASDNPLNLSDNQIISLNKINDELNNISDENQEEYWLINNKRSFAIWEQVRNIARNALNLLNNTSNDA